jgi:hypothetical protein
MDFREQLKRQLGFLERSADAFDRGHQDEAIRIAVSIRVILHETPSSRPLLAHLGARNVRLVSTARWVDRAPIFADLLSMLGPGGAQAPLGQSSTRLELPAATWWSQIVYAVGRGGITRKNLVLGAANRDGGAHVDERLTEDYEQLTKLWTRVTDDGEAGEDMPVHLIGLRQMAWELLNSPKLLALARSTPDFRDASVDERLNCSLTAP